ncbi:short chain dehydrogenase [Corynebacterium suranareeae]|uniref:Short chain dehydrogenase n=1 Tax=Corynebacterium suranareeae TaxID=2506452 RepID=A0A160PP55_9CORY|nr:SDR family oxidoreductase [Corynebacterium suranareeae]BAU94361.1 short chain dehydrogenase [Corynebacterium suranareeae]
MENYVNHSPIEAQYPDLPGKTMVVTGAAQGMGRLFATQLASRGVNVVITDLNDTVLEAAEEINQELAEANLAQESGKVVGVVADVTKKQDHEKTLSAAVENFGGLHGWINNAGVFPEAESLDIPESQFDLAFDVNTKGTLFGSQVAAGYMKDHGGGSIVNMASVAALRIRRGRGAYNTAKAGTLQLSYSLAVELGDFNVRVNAVAPGFIDTAMTQWVHEREGALEHALGNVPLHRIGAPVEVFAAVLFLLSDSARYITGSCISVDGGSRHV